MGRSSLGFWLGSTVNFLYSLFSQPILRGLPRVARSPFFEVSAHGYNPGRGGGGAGAYSWDFLVGCATWFFKSWPDFRPKNVIFHTHFQTRTIKSIPIFRPGLYPEIMLSLIRLECKQKKFFESNWNSHTVLSFLLIWDWNHKYFHTLFSALENHTRFQTKMGKVYTRFQTKTAQKPGPMGQHIPI